jgi:hypothetical protein
MVTRTKFITDIYSIQFEKKKKKSKSDLSLYIRIIIHNNNLPLVILLCMKV